MSSARSASRRLRSSPAPPMPMLLQPRGDDQVAGRAAPRCRRSSGHARCPAAARGPTGAQKLAKVARCRPATMGMSVSPGVHRRLRRTAPAAGARRAMPSRRSVFWWLRRPACQPARWRRRRAPATDALDAGEAGDHAIGRRLADQLIDRAALGLRCARKAPYSTKLPSSHRSATFSRAVRRPERGGAPSPRGACRAAGPRARAACSVRGAARLARWRARAAPRPAGQLRAPRRSSGVAFRPAARPARPAARARGRRAGAQLVLHLHGLDHGEQVAGAQWPGPAHGRSRPPWRPSGNGSPASSCDDCGSARASPRATVVAPGTDTHTMLQFAEIAAAAGA